MEPTLSWLKTLGPLVELCTYQITNANMRKKGWESAFSPLPPPKGIFLFGCPARSAPGEEDDCSAALPVFSFYIALGRNTKNVWLHSEQTSNSHSLLSSAHPLFLFSQLKMNGRRSYPILITVRRVTMLLLRQTPSFLFSDGFVFQKFALPLLVPVRHKFSLAFPAVSCLSKHTRKSRKSRTICAFPLLPRHKMIFFVSLVIPSFLSRKFLRVFPNPDSQMAFAQHSH